MEPLRRPLRFLVLCRIREKVVPGVVEKVGEVWYGHTHTHLPNFLPSRVRCQEAWGGVTHGDNLWFDVYRGPPEFGGPVFPVPT